MINKELFVVARNIKSNRESRHLCLLDRNAVSLICKYSSSQLTRGMLDYGRIRYLHQLDKLGNIISVFASTLEGINPQNNNLTNEYRHRQLNNEIRAVKYFFKKARTDVDFIAPHAHELSSHDMFQSFTRCMHFLCEASQILHQPLAPEKCLTTCGEILSIADSCDIPKAHPVVICAIACLFGNIDAFRTLKFRKKYTFSVAYNAMSDITNIMFTAHTHALQKNDNQKMSVHFISFDSSLINIFNNFIQSDFHANISNDYNENIENNINQNISFTLGKLPEKFFPKCSSEEYNKIIQLLYY